MKSATELLTAYLSEIQDPAAAAALFADDGVIELPWVDARAQGPVEIEEFLQGLLAKVPISAFGTFVSGSKRPNKPSANTMSRRLCQRLAKLIDRPTPAASSRRTERSSSCERHSIQLRPLGHSARIRRFYLPQARGIDC